MRTRSIAVWDSAPERDAVLRALDGHEIQRRNERWTAYVAGVHVDPQGEWVQIAIEGRTHADVVLHLRRPTSVAAAIAALDRYDPIAGVRPHVIEV
jgi:hypothetical protein